MSPAYEIVTGYIEEVRTYLPEMEKGLAGLADAGSAEAAVNDISRLATTVRQASSLVGLPGLSAIAGVMNASLADIPTDNPAAVTPEVIAHFKTLIARLDDYCDQVVADGAPARQIVEELLIDRAKAFGVPEDTVPDGIDIESLPVIEGGAPAEKDEDGEEDEDIIDPGDEIVMPDDPLFADAVSDVDDLSDIMALSESLEAELPEIEPLDDETPDETPPSPVPEPEETPIPIPDLSAIPDELLDSFYQESREHLEDLDTAMTTLESSVTGPTPISDLLREVVRKIRRSVHTLKGASAVIGLSTIAAWGHAFEDFLDWLYEDATELTPEIIALLVESEDLMTYLVENPKDPKVDRIKAFKARFAGIISTSKGAPGRVAAPTPVNKAQTAPDQESQETASSAEAMTVRVAPDVDAGDESGESTLSDAQARSAHTLRVETERVDDLVNLIGELIIVTSAVEQQISFFTETLNELEWSRNRLREIARSMEVGFEVKALGNLSLFQSAGQAGGAMSLLPSLSEDFDALELDRYSELNMVIRTLNESAIDVGSIFSRLTGFYTEIDGALNRQRVVLSELQDKMMGVRMVPLRSLSSKLRRTAREVAKFLKKKVRMVIEGEDIELDRLIWDRLTDPLMHLLRNAIDHGIEQEETRRNRGKSPVATLKLAAAREGNQVVIRISDDGKGLDFDGIRRRAVSAGLLNPGSDPSEDELAAFIFKPGFTTKDAISEVSGRGVGMDVVRENIQEIKGAIRVTSRSGVGTRFTIRIPLTLAAVRALLFGLGERTFAIALNEVKEIVRTEADNLIEAPWPSVRLGKEVIPITSLAELLLPRRDERPIIERGHHLLLIVEVNGQRKALEIDRLIAQREIVIKSTGTHLRYVRGISGVTIVGDGSVVPILNVGELIGESIIDGGAVGRSTAPDEGETVMETAPLTIMVVDDSVSIRQVVSRLIEDQGWRVVTAKDGLEALERLRQTRPDLIVLDIEMPRMNGYEFLMAIRAEPEYKDVPVLMLTSRATTKHQEKAMNLGAKGFVFKPYNSNEFIDVILKLVN